MTSQPSALLDEPRRLMGAQRPRVSHVPPYLASTGVEAIELVERGCGRQLDDWQRWVVMGALGERADGQWSSPEVGLSVPRRNGKGDIIMAVELAAMFVMPEITGQPVEILHSAHEFKTAADAFRRIKGVVECTPDLARKVFIREGSGKEAIERLDGHARLRFVARSKGSGRGFDGDFVFLDEAFALEESHIDALIPVLSARANPQVWYVSSPALDAVTGAVWMGIRKRGEARDPGLMWADWGCEAGADPGDPANWAQSNPALGIRVGVEAVEREYRSMSPEGFGRERLGIWPETAGTALISPELWASLALPPEKRRADVVFGSGAAVFALDVSPDRQTASIVACGNDAEGRHIVAIADKRAGTDWIPARAKQLTERYGPLVWVLDAKSPAAALIADLATVGIKPPEADRTMRGDLVVMGAGDMAIAWGRFIDRVRASGLLHPDDPALNVALATAKTRPLGDGSAWARSRSTVDITPLVAATEASWALEAFADVTAELQPSAFWV